MTGQEWIDGFNATMAEFVAERRLPSCSVRISFRTGDTVMVRAVRAGPLLESLLIDPYPEDLSTMVTRDDDEHAGGDATPSRMLVPLPEIVRVEFLVEAPGEHPLGFAAP
jgi:hypothetical protein